MLIKSYKDVVPYRLDDGEAKGAYLRPLISNEDGAGNFHLSLLRLEPGGKTANHRHPYSLQIYVRKGDGEMITSSNLREIGEGDVLLIFEEEEYQIRNKSHDVDLELLTITPADATDREALRHSDSSNNTDQNNTTNHSS